MRVLLQKVSSGQVVVENATVGAIQTGFVALVGITHEDTQADAEVLAHKIAHLRVFADENDKMNLSVLDVGGGVLVISQFTLYADARRGRRPDFMQAARPNIAEPLVNYLVQRLHHEGVQHVPTGVFGAMMQVTIINEGPVTIWLDSAELNKKA
jgi:D-tyrosyl-tRNA(Tyr) deacylase